MSSITPLPLWEREGPAVSGGGGGGGQMVGDNAQHAVCVLEDFIVPEAEDPIAFGIHEAGARFVILRGICMLATVSFDDEFCAVRAEVREIRTEWNLPAKPGLGKALTKRAPEVLFGRCTVAAELPGTDDRVGSEKLTLGQAVFIPPHPPTRLRHAGPSLSHEGRGDHWHARHSS